MTLQHKGITVFYTDEGQGNPVVFLHGFLENSTMWQAFIPELTKKNRVICIDLLGHGKTECLGYIHTMELMAEVVEAVLNQLKITKSTLIGHSMGGYVALAFAEKNPKNLKGLCLMNSTSLPDTEEKKRNRDRAIIAVKQNYKTFVRIAVNNLFRPKNRIVFADKIKDVVNEALKTPLQGIVAALEGMKIRKDRQHLLQSPTFKKMMIISKKDPALDYKTLIAQAKNTDVKKVEFPDGHMSHIENQDDFLIEIMHFIENI
ncbi:pimeloyl-ACP methyl ester carboxylesterase [Mariniflexile fucanivorans]|uniref:Pimeloyl-ACP methyl ester carboxylesterase n=1 Tax=Mariniflexile fucanivorans TaxID=264023 RepID=A0A4R1RR30_9FLAO|nr:alpha/beta hydrolase [Mariniflexile fucanivorans]TCL68878.1 pimeloyl-ACP methyl ester carboxylesterase [Mariniflexile fucanivorans]